MIRDPRQPEIGIVSAEEQERAAQLKASVDASWALSEATGCSIGEALVMLGRQPADESMGAATDLAAMTFADLCDDSDRMHDVVLALMSEKRLSYMEGLDYLLHRHDEVAQWVSGDERDAITLSAVLADSGVSMARVMTLVADQENVRALAMPAKGIAKRDVDEWGRVRRPMGDDLDALLADPLVVRREYRRARDQDLVWHDGLGLEPDDDESFPLFESTWRAETTQGYDLVATLELRELERQAELKAQQQVAAIEQKVQQERLDSARAHRTLANQLAEDANRLDGGQ